MWLKLPVLSTLALTTSLVVVWPAVSGPPYTEFMTPKLANFIKAGKALDADEREIAVLALQHVDELEQAEIDTAWDEEIDRRVDEVLSGKVQLVTGQETLTMARAMLAARRSQ